MSRGQARDPKGAAWKLIDKWNLKAMENVERLGWGGDRTNPSSSGLA